jgi:hypothetical protein
MTYVPANPQFLAPGQPAPEGSPQTQFVVPSTDGPEVVAEARAAAVAAYAAAEQAGKRPIPPAGVYLGVAVAWTPGG